jgi:TolA-binding protein
VNRLSTTGTENPVPVPLSSRAEQAVSGIKPSENFSKIPFKAPRAFKDDLEVPSGGGEDYMLKNIVQGPFLMRNWEEARENLTEFLSLPRSSSAENRARFYLGQTYYYSGSYREALFEFLLIRDVFPAESGEWVQASLSAMVKKP